PDHPFARFLTRRWVGPEVLSGLEAFAHPRHRSGHGGGVSRARNLPCGGGGDDVRRLTGNDPEDGDLTGHERIELRRHRAFVGFERTETDESGISPLPVGGEFRSGMLGMELDGNAMRSRHSLEL